jgi:hypothetical protein
LWARVVLEDINNNKKFVSCLVCGQELLGAITQMLKCPPKFENWRLSTHHMNPTVKRPHTLPAFQSTSLQSSSTSSMSIDLNIALFKKMEIPYLT